MDKKQAQKELDQLKVNINQFNDRVKELEKIINEPEISKGQEMSDFLFSLLKERTDRITGEKQTTSYNSKGEWLIQQDYKNSTLWVSYWRIWQYFESKFDLNYIEIKDFIKVWIETNTGWKGLTPKSSRALSLVAIETNTGWKGLTPTVKLGGKLYDTKQTT